MGPKPTADIKIAVKEALKEILTDDEFLNRLLSKVNDKLESLQKTVQQNTDTIKRLEGRLESMQQAEKVNSICIYNMAEENEGNLTQQFITLCKNKLKMEINRNNIIKCYRVGNNRDKPRPTIVKFEQYHTKFELLKNCGNLRGTKIGIMEDLTKSRLEIYQVAQQRFDRKNTFTRFGNVYVKVNNKIEKVSNLACLDTI